MSFPIEIVKDGKSEVVQFTPGDRVRFETHFDQPWHVALDPERTRETHWLWMAWCVTHRNERWDEASFLEWCDGLTSVRMANLPAGDGEDPT